LIHSPTAKNIRLATSHAGFGWCETLAKRSVFVINDFSRLRGRKRCVRSCRIHTISLQLGGSSVNQFTEWCALVPLL